jgi:V8-like Glu-specific endopeptidase
MWNWRFTFIVAIYSVLCIGCTLSQNKFITAETIDEIKKITVPIICGAPASDGTFKITKTIGSAFFINNEGFFMTAGHVLDDWNKIDKSKGDCFPALYIPKGGWQSLTDIRWLRFDQCLRSNNADVAVCKSINNPFTLDDVKQIINIATFSTLPLADGTPVAFTGFPLDSWRPITSIGDIASLNKTDNLIVIDRNAWPGASGSPVYLSDGVVIGVLIKRGINDGSGLAYALTTKAVLDFLRENKIGFQQKDEK